MFTLMRKKYTSPWTWTVSIPRSFSSLQVPESELNLFIYSFGCTILCVHRDRKCKVQVLTLLFYAYIDVFASDEGNEKDTKIAPGGYDSNRVQNQPFIPGHKQYRQCGSIKRSSRFESQKQNEWIKTTFFRLVAGLHCRGVLGSRSTYVPALQFGAQNICPPSERISNHCIPMFVCDRPPPRPVPGQGGGSSSWTVQEGLENHACPGLRSEVQGLQIVAAKGPRFKVRPSRKKILGSRFKVRASRKNKIGLRFKEKPVWKFNIALK